MFFRDKDIYVVTVGYKILFLLKIERQFKKTLLKLKKKTTLFSNFPRHDSTKEQENGC